jgi:ATP-dependent protease ClpP protease subunit
VNGFNYPRTILSDIKAVAETVKGDRLTVETLGNHLYFYADVNSDRVLALIRSLKETDQYLRNERLNRQVPPDFDPVPIWIHINSNGGYVNDGLLAYDTIREVSQLTPVYTVVEGLAASAATLMSVAGEKRFITPSSLMMVHQLSGAVYGTHEEFKDEVRGQEMMMKLIRRIYEQRCQIDKKTLNEMLKRNYWLNADDALRLGFVGEIMGQTKPKKKKKK